MKTDNSKHVWKVKKDKQGRKVVEAKVKRNGKHLSVTPATLKLIGEIK